MKILELIASLKKNKWNSLLVILIFASSIILFVNVIISTVLVQNKGEAILEEQVLYDLSAISKSKSDQVLSSIEQDFERTSLVASRTQLRKSLIEFDNTEDAYSADESRALMVKILQDAKDSVSAIKDIDITNLEGSIVASTSNNYNNENESINKEFLKNGVQGKYLSSIYVENENFMYNTVVPLIHPDTEKNDVIGFIRVKFSLERLMALLNDHTGLKNTGEILLVSKVENRYIVMNFLRHQNDSALTEVRGSINAFRNATNGDSGIVVENDYRGIQSLHAYNHLPLEGKKLGLIVKIDVAEIFLPLSTLRRDVILTGVIIWIIGSIILSVIISILLSPLNKTINGIKKLGDGDLEHRLDVPVYNELEKLSVAFNDMAENLQKTTISRNDLKIEIQNRVKMEKTLKVAKQEAEAANIAKSQFLANMSHEIRTPMNGILGFLQLLENTKLNQEQLDYIEMMKDSTDTLLNVINDILDVSKIEAGKVELENITFDLRATVETAVMPLAAKASEKGVDINMLIRSDVPQFVCGDPTRLKQILINLIGNAIKFTDKGEVFVAVEKKYQEDKTHYIRFSVKDTGIGMTQETIKKLFKPFSQADTSSTRRYGGTGLGLTISKAIVGIMNGKIVVKSDFGEGSEFCFTLPFEESESADVQAVIDYAILKGKKILIVDDNETNRYIAKSYLKEVGCLTLTAESATEAIAMLVAEKDIYSAVLVDYHMPNMNGYDLAAALKAIPSTNNLPLILITSVKEKGEAKRAKEKGFSAYLTKPYKRSDLLDCVAMVFRGGKSDEKNKKEILTKHIANEVRINKRLKILLVEDNEVNCKFFIKLLKSQGLSCDVAVNGEEAVNACADKSYDVIFMDCQMPVMDGYEATRKIRQAEGEEKHTPIIAMTAYAMEGDREKCIKAGMDDYISKPVSLDLVYKVLRGNMKSKEIEYKYFYNFATEAGISKDDAEEILRDYTKELSDHIKGIKNAIEKEDYETIGKRAHQLKGSSGNLRIFEIYDLVKKLGEVANKQQKEVCKRIVADIERYI